LAGIFSFSHLFCDFYDQIHIEVFDIPCPDVEGILASNKQTTTRSAKSAEMSKHENPFVVWAK
jgi:hypothetical protein